MSYYCDQLAENSPPNRQIIYKLLDDFHCVITKSFGDTDGLTNQVGSLGSEVDRLKAQIQQYKDLIAELERKIQELTQDNQELQFCLEEQCQLRGDLENIVAQLKEQIARQDEIIACLTAEKLELLALIRQLEVELEKFKNQVVDLEDENGNLTKGMKGLEMSKEKCSDLQMALAECCERCDTLQKENFGLRQEIRELEGRLDAACFETGKANSELECLKQTFQEEKDGLEAQLCRLVEEQSTFKTTKASLCRKLNEAISAHHDELDRLKTESDMYQDQLEREREQKEDLVRKYQDCENKRATTSSMSALGPCADLRRQLSLASERAQRFQDMYDKEATERRQLEKQLINLENDNYDLKAKVSAVGQRSRRGSREGSVGRSPQPPERRRSRGSQSGGENSPYF